MTGRGFTWPDAAALGAVVFAWILLIVFSEGPLALTIVDDAYIYLRVIENWLSGAGWTYNTGVSAHSLNPLTSPVYALFLALVRSVTRAGPAALLVAYSSGLLMLVFVQYLALRDCGRLFAMVAAMTTSTCYILRHSVGMETSVYLALVLATAFAYQKGRYFATGVLSGLVALARPEGVALAAAIGLLHLLAHRRILWPLVVGCALVVLPWLLASWAAFGEVLPYTVRVKATQAGIGAWAEEGKWLAAFLGQPAIPAATYSIAGVGAAWAWREFVQRRPYVLVILVFGAIQVLGYSLLRAPVGYFWYFAPGNLAIDTLVVGGIFMMARSVVGWWQGRSSRKRNNDPRGQTSSSLRRVSLGLGCVLAVLLASQIGAAEWRGIKPYRFAKDYTEAGSWISGNTPREARVASTEIGYLGYYSHRGIRDIHAVIHPEALERLERSEWDWWFTTDPPEVVVVHEPPAHGEPSPKWWPEDSLRGFEARYSEVFRTSRLKVYALNTLEPHT